MLPARQRQAQRLRVLKHRQPERLVQPVLLQRERVQLLGPVQERELLLSFRKQRGQRQQ
jgi:hypothetical protein